MKSPRAGAIKNISVIDSATTGADGSLRVSGISRSQSKEYAT